MKKKLLIVFLAFLVFTLVSGLACKKETPVTEDKAKPTEPAPSYSLTFWGLWDDSSVFQPLIDRYQNKHPNVKINYRKWEYAEYEGQVTEALAAGRGPDIWMIHNTWLGRHMEKLAPMPESEKFLDRFKIDFVEVVADDFIVDDQIYGKALSVDTLALYYNKDLLNTAHLTYPPETWEDFKAYTEKLTKFDDWGNITQAGTALGTAKNINRAADILSLLMLQNGTRMTNEERTAATFNQTQTTREGKSFNPGLEALTFYTDFANPKKKVYTWNPTMPYSLDAFCDEKAAMMFNFSFRDSGIKARAPKLNYAIAPVPQIKDTPKEVNFANYWGLVVSKASENPQVAWDFINFLTSAEIVEEYCKSTGRPASRVDVLDTQLEDPVLGTFAGQALTAKSWYRGKDPTQTEAIILDMIEKVVLGEKEAKEAMDYAASQVSTLMK